MRLFSVYGLVVLALLGAVFFAFWAGQPVAAECDHTIGLEVEVADGRGHFSAVEPGDTVCLAAGTRPVLRLHNFHGATGQPITFINNGGVVQIAGSDENYAGIHIKNSTHLQLTGSGVLEQCGAEYSEEEQRCGIVIQNSNRGVVGSHKTEFIEIDHVEVSGTNRMGIFARTSSENNINRETWIQHDTLVHHNYLHHIGTEGAYIGGSKYQLGEDPVLIGVELSHNLVTDTGWNGLQVGSAVAVCAIHHNRVLRDSQKNNENQRSGISNNWGSVCDIYNNYIADGISRGIYIQGNGGNRVYNNVIVRPGRTAEDKGDGIVVSTGSNTDNSIYVWHNTIIEPARYGILYRNENGHDNKIQNNIIIRSGHDNMHIDINEHTNVSVDYNVLLSDLAAARFANPAIDDYTLLPDSPAVDAGLDLTEFGIQGDFLAVDRPQCAASDAGAFEYVP